MEVVGFGRVDGRTAVSEDLQDFVEVCEDVAASESVFVMTADHVNPSKSTVKTLSLRSNPGKKRRRDSFLLLTAQGGPRL